MILQNPKTDIQNLFIGRVQYIQSHAIFVLWLGYGILFLMAFFETLVKNNLIFKILGVTAVLLLPAALIYKNYNNEGQLKVVGGAEQNGHDFGWQFGNWQLRGVDGIKDDMRYWYPDEAEFEEQWAAYPCKDYPPPMGTNAIFFGGTDPGRFVPTYMIYSAKVRPDVYLITQNALADNTYMNVMRDLYGDQIWIPSPIDSNIAFQKYVDGVRSGKIKAGADVTTEGGKVQVQGVAGVMQINGFLSEMIFDHNQYRTETKTDEKTRPTGAAVVYDDPGVDPETGKPPRRTFYVEESYVLPWMYPYLTPHGLIMKINNERTPLTDEMIANDTAFWNWYCDRLLSDERFIRDIVARKSFCKLRSAIAGLYENRNRPKEAEAAFRQAVALYDLSPEANFRLANHMMRGGRFDEAIELFDVFLEKDPNNAQARQFQEQVKRQQAASGQRQLLEQKLRNGQIEFNETMQLMALYIQMRQIRQADALASHLIKDEKTPPQALMQIAQLMAQAQRLRVVEEALTRYTVLKPKDPQGWINLAALKMVMNKRAEVFEMLRQAVDCGGEPARNIIRSDKRFDPIRQAPEYQKIIPAKTVQPGSGMLPLPGM
jgi:tetratricopeptide (TPR) repeat protein